jgi:hypothetical protein
VPLWFNISFGGSKKSRYQSLAFYQKPRYSIFIRQVTMFVLSERGIAFLPHLSNRGINPISFANTVDATLRNTACAVFR